MGRKRSTSRNYYLRGNTLPEVCPSTECGIDLHPSDTAETTVKGVKYRYKCPGCGTLFDQACPSCGSKEFQVVEGVEECLRCGEVLKLGTAHIPDRSHK